MHELALDMPDFVHKITTHPDLLCMFGLKGILSELEKVLVLDSPSPQLLSYDTTFSLGDFYISVLSYRHTLFKEAPTIPAAFLLHERKFQAHHKEMFEMCCKLVPSLNDTTYPIVTDDEQAIVNSISAVLCNAAQFKMLEPYFQRYQKMAKKSWGSNT